MRKTNFRSAYLNAQSGWHCPRRVLTEGQRRSDSYRRNWRMGGSSTYVACFERPDHHTTILPCHLIPQILKDIPKASANHVLLRIRGGTQRDRVSATHNTLTGHGTENISATLPDNFGTCPRPCMVHRLYRAVHQHVTIRCPFYLLRGYRNHLVVGTKWTNWVWTKMSEWVLSNRRLVDVAEAVIQLAKVVVCISAPESNLPKNK